MLLACTPFTIQMGLHQHACASTCLREQAAAAMLLGAQGFVLGTRLVATHECAWPEAHKQALVAAGSQARLLLLSSPT